MFAKEVEGRKVADKLFTIDSNIIALTNKVEEIEYGYGSKYAFDNEKQKKDSEELLKYLQKDIFNDFKIEIEEALKNINLNISGIEEIMSNMKRGEITSL